MTAAILSGLVYQSDVNLLIPRVQGSAMQLVVRSLKTGNERCILSKPLQMKFGFAEFNWNYYERLAYEAVTAIDPKRQRIATIHVMGSHQTDSDDILDIVVMTITYSGQIVSRDPYTIGSKDHPDFMGFDTSGKVALVVYEGSNSVKRLTSLGWTKVINHEVPSGAQNPWNERIDEELYPSHRADDLSTGRNLYWSMLPTRHMSSSFGGRLPVKNQREGTYLLYSLETLAVRSGQKESSKPNEPILEYGYPLSYPFVIGRVSKFKPLFPRYDPLMRAEWDPFIDSTIFLVNLESGERQRVCDGIYAVPLQ